MSSILILDIGKTNIKVHVLDGMLESLYESTTPNSVKDDGVYPHFDVDAIWDWFCAVTADLAARFSISAISVTTHGATAALIDRNSSGSGLVLPVLDYEHVGPDTITPEYAQFRPDFSETSSPDLSAGLNLGRQLFWLQQCFPEAFSKATDILLYPQYWVWRMTGKLCAERTSLGCHTDLWSPEENDYSSLVKSMGWRELFPALKPAKSLIGCISAEFRARTGLPDFCQVAVGIHDSNASYLRYVLENDGQPFSVISTGTWAITMTNGGGNTHLDESRDMLMNVDYRGKPVACARFMGGREYEVICEKMRTTPEAQFDIDDIEKIITQGVYALPQFCDSSGPFSGSAGSILGTTHRIKGSALASLYCALMLDLELDLLQATGPVFIEGAFVKNRFLCRTLAALREAESVYLSDDSTGTVKGAALLFFSNESGNGKKILCDPLPIKGLVGYKLKWREYCQSLKNIKMPD